MFAVRSMSLGLLFLLGWTPCGTPAAPRPSVHPRRNLDEFPPVEARYIRFVVHATNRGEPCLDELEIYGPDDESRNLALASHGARATASGSLEGYSIHQLAGVHDGRYGNGQSWIADRIDGAWVQIELPQPARIHRVVWSRDRESRFIDRLATRYEIAVALDPNDWRIVASSDDRESLGVGEALTGNPSLTRPLVNRFAPISTALPLESSQGTSTYGIDVWQTSDGLPGNTVTSLQQTRDGYLWVGTLNGLARFDGIRFKHFDTALPLPNRRVLCLLAARDGALWIGTSGGLIRFRDGTFQGWTAQDGLSSDRVTALAEDTDGNVWIGTENGLCGWNGSRFVEPPPNAGPGTQTADLMCDARQALWAVVDNRLMTPNADGIMQPPDLPDPSSFTSVFTVQAGHSGRIWFGGANSYVGSISNDVVRTFPQQPGQLLGAIWALCETRAGDLWIGTANDGLRRLRDGVFESLTTQDGLSDNSVQCLLEDREGSLWVGTVSGGLNRVRPRRVTTLTTRDGLGHNVVMSLAEDEAGTMWIGSNCGGLTTRRDGVLAPHHASYLLDNECIWSLLAANDGSVWVGTWGAGLFRLRGREVENFPMARPGNDEPVAALTERAGGGLWVGTVEGGLKKFHDGEVTDEIPTAGMLETPITALVQEPGGALWIGTDGGGLHRYKDEKMTAFTRQDGLPGNFIRSLYRDGDGVLWIGTRGGLGRWQDGAFSALTRAQGLPDEVISQILEDDRDHLWFGSNQGIFRVARAELERAAREPAFQVNPLIFGLADGMASLECTGGFHPSGLKTGDGRLWFSTVKGLVMVDPARLHVNEIPPPVRVEEILVDGSPVNPAGHSKSNIGRGESGSIAIGPGARRVEIHYTALSLAVPERNRFKHRLEGLEPRWVEAGPQRVATYPRLAPGRYRFHVVACNNDGIWNETGATLALTVLPAFWQTWWFRAAVLVLLLTAGSWAVRHASQRRLRRKLSVLEHQHGLERERARIARDIHDELGASLTRITLLTELGLKNRERPEQWTATLGKISATARESVRAMDAIVWAVNPRNDSLDHFANYLSQFAEELFRLTPIRCRIDMPTVLPEHALTTETRHQLLLAVKEALNNVIRHSRADEVWLRLRVDDGQLELAIEDDGCGLPTEDPGDGHDGLTNIRSRVEGLAGRCEMQSQPGHGTVLRMIVPLPRPIAP